MSRPSFLGAAGIEDTSCEQGVAWVRDMGLNPFTVSFGTNRCGDLAFQGEYRSIALSWVPRSGVFGTWVNSWQLKERRLEGQDTMPVLFQLVVPADSEADTTLTVVLPNRADAVSLRLFINADGTVASTASSFDGATDEAATQFWRHIAAPLLDSVVGVSQSTVRVYWRNQTNASRDSVDETQIYRDGTWVGRTFGATHTFDDNPVSAGVHHYQIRHRAPPSPSALGWPNSAFSTELAIEMPPADTDTTQTPFQTSIQTDLLILQDSTYSWERQVSGGTPPYQDQWYYSDSTAEHGWSGLSEVGTNSATYSQYVERLEDDYAFILTDTTTDADARRVGTTSYNWVFGTSGWRFSGVPADQLGRLENGRCRPLPTGRTRHEWLERLIRTGGRPRLCVLARP